MTLKPGLGSLKVIENYPIQSGTHDFLLTFHSNHRPISTVSEINGDVRRKSNENRQFSHPRVFNAPADGVPLGILYRRRGLRKLEWRAFRWSKKFSDRFSRFDTIPECDGHPATQPPSQPRCRSYYAQRSGVEPKKSRSQGHVLATKASQLSNGQSYLLQIWWEYSLLIIHCVTYFQVSQA